MADLMTQDVFRFVNIRPPEKTDIVTDSRFLIVDNDREESQLFKTLTDDEIEKTAKTEALKKFRESDRFINGYAGLDHQTRKLVIIATKVLRRLGAGKSSKIKTLIEKQVGNGFSIDTWLAARGPLKRKLWDSLYAVIFSPEKAHSRECVSELRSILRIVSILEHWPTSDADFQDGRSLLSIDWRLDSRLFPKPTHLYSKVQKARGELTEERAIFTKKKIEHIKSIINHIDAKNYLEHLVESLPKNNQPPHAPVQSPTISKRGLFSRFFQNPRLVKAYPSDMSLDSRSLKLKQLPLGKRNYAGTISRIRGVLQTYGIDADTDMLLAERLVEEGTRKLFNALTVHASIGEIIRVSKLFSQRDSQRYDVIKGEEHLGDLHNLAGMAGTFDVFSSLSRSLPTQPVDPDKLDELKGDSDDVLPGRREPCDFSDLKFPVGCVKPAGVGDLNILEQTLIKYEPGEIAHIENILQGESKTRAHRRLDRTETTLFSSLERSEEKLEDLRKTNRFEMSRETSEVISTRMSVEGGLTVSGSYGTVNFQTYLNASLENSRESTSRDTTNFAREITEQARTRVEEKVRTEETVITVREIEETNDHILNNLTGEDHVSGAYQWVNKKYCVRVKNYGKRLFYEFVVPEPASFYRHIHTGAELKGINVEEPVHPNKLAKEAGSYVLEDWEELLPEHIFWFNYERFANAYGATSIKPPPPTFIYTGKAYGHPPDFTPSSNDFSIAQSGEIDLPPRYEPLNAAVISEWSYSFPQAIIPAAEAIYKRGVAINLGTTRFFNYLTFKVNESNNLVVDAQLVEEGWLMIGGDGTLWEKVPITIFTLNVGVFTTNVVILTKITELGYREWQVETWKNILDAYRLRKSEFDEAVRANRISSGVTIAGNNPLTNRIIEKDELQRQCMNLLTSWDFVGFGSTVNDVPPYGYPEMYTDLAQWNARIVQFFEQAFEWSQMTYVFYPYFWARKEKWPDLARGRDTDPIFKRFLQAGSARVLVPVSPNYEEAVSYYVRTGYLWSGGDIPTVDEDLYVSTIEEFKQEYDLTDFEYVGLPWVITLPTSLVTLRPELLPSWEDEVKCEESIEEEPPADEEGTAEGSVMESLRKAVLGRVKETSETSTETKQPSE